MPDDRFQVRFWGVRGSLPSPGPATWRTGGHTSCVELVCGPHRLLLDAGSGAKPAARALLAEGVEQLHVFLSHWHYDHVIGLPFLLMMLPQGFRVSVASALDGLTTREAMERFMAWPYFPVTPHMTRAALECRDLRRGEAATCAPGLEVATCALAHPGGATGYRVAWAGRSCCYLTDHEQAGSAPDGAVARFIRGADLVIMDTTYTEEELPACSGYGHSSWQQAVSLAKEAGVARLALFHHFPGRTDDQVDAIEAEARGRFRGSFAAREGVTLDL
jgi:phosphoribosyl 1,2-cyclic phosphodiesterase